MLIAPATSAANAGATVPASGRRTGDGCDRDGIADVLAAASAKTSGFPRTGKIPFWKLTGRAGVHATAGGTIGRWVNQSPVWSAGIWLVEVGRGNCF